MPGFCSGCRQGNHRMPPSLPGRDSLERTPPWQSLAILKLLGKVTACDIVVDARLGIVIMRPSWNQRGPGAGACPAACRARIRSRRQERLDLD